MYKIQINDKLVLKFIIIFFKCIGFFSLIRRDHDKLRKIA